MFTRNLLNLQRTQIYKKTQIRFARQMKDKIITIT